MTIPWTFLVAFLIGVVVGAVITWIAAVLVTLFRKRDPWPSPPRSPDW